MKYTYVGLVIVLATLAITVSFAPPAAAQSAKLPYELTFSGTSIQGEISGLWGGTYARGAYTGGRWVLVAEGRIVAAGTYSCGGGCTFNGSVEYDRITNFSLSAPTLSDTPGTETVSGSVPLYLRPPTIWQ